jgi:hypothetical protein
MHSRRLTVSRQHPDGRAVGYRRAPIALMPFLPLRGRWLDEPGFYDRRERARGRVGGPAGAGSGRGALLPAWTQCH